MNGRHYIDGAWVEATAAQRIRVLDPVDGSTAGSVPRGTAADVDRAVAAARRAFVTWSITSMEERIALIDALCAGIEARRDDLAEVLTQEMGAPLAFARAAQVGVALADLAALRAAAGAHVFETEVSNSLVVQEPVGVVAAITPWNFPLHQIVLKVGAALLAGCTVVLKPSEVAPLNAVVLTEISHEIGVPPGVVNVVHGDGAGVGSPLVAHPGVDLVTFTGSRAVGESIARAAAVNITRVALELGGKSAAIVLDDAPMRETAEQVVRSCFANAGQTCAALSRVLVPEHQLAAWEDALRAAAQAWGVGDPRDPATDVGPLASIVQRDRVRAHIDEAHADGATLLFAPQELTGLPEGGAWLAPVVFTGVTPEMRIFREEVFGPVLAVTSYREVDEAVDLANDSVYGLSGGVWSQNRGRALDVARRVRTGTIGINGAGLDVGAPFGGVKQSGIGRECGVQGFEEFLETKSVMGGLGLI